MTSPPFRTVGRCCGGSSSSSEVHPFCECEPGSLIKIYVDVVANSGTHYYRTVNGNFAEIFKFDGDDMNAAIGGTYSVEAECFDTSYGLWAENNYTSTIYRQVHDSSFGNCPETINPTAANGVRQFGVWMAALDRILFDADEVVAWVGDMRTVTGFFPIYEPAFPSRVVFRVPRSCEDPIELPYSDTQDLVLYDQLNWQASCPLPSPAGVWGTATLRIEFEPPA